MSTEAKKYWKKISVDLDNIGVLTIVDETALEILCETYSEWRAACESLKSYGSPTFETVTKDGSIMFRNRPEVAVKADTERRMKAMLTEFGLTPASRTKVAGRDDNGTENRFAKFGNKTDGSSR